MSDYSKTLGCRIRRLRKQLDLTQAELGDILGLGRSGLGKIERNEINPSVRMLRILSSRFDVSVEHIVTGRGELFYKGEPETAPAEFSGEEAELFDLMKRLPLVRYSVMSYFQKFKIDNRQTIQQELGET